MFVYHHILTNIINAFVKKRKNTFDKSSLLKNTVIHVYKFTINFTNSTYCSFYRTP